MIMKAIAKITSTKGLRGEMKVRFFYDMDISPGDSVLLEQRNNSYIPYIVEYIKDTVKDGLTKVLKLEGVDHIDTATKLTKKELWLEDDFYEETLAEDSNYRLLGYEVYDEESLLGEITDIIEQAQVTLVIGNADQGIYIPMVDEWVKELDHENEKIIMTLPTGLVNINQFPS